MTPALPLAHYEKTRGPRCLGEMWHKAKGLYAITCTVTTHPMGWELRLGAGDTFFRTKVCTTDGQVKELSDTWSTEAHGKGWT